MEHLPPSRIHENAIRAWKLSAAVFGLLLYLVPAFFYLLYSVDTSVSILVPMITAPVTFIVHLLMIFVFPRIRWKRWRYSVTELGVDMYRGILIRKRTIVPINRVQHVDTKQGPIYRKYGLSSISLSTAATTHEIPALDDETANRLRTLISELVRNVKEDV